MVAVGCNKGFDWIDPCFDVASVAPEPHTVAVDLVTALLEGFRGAFEGLGECRGGGWRRELGLFTGRGVAAVRFDAGDPPGDEGGVFRKLLVL